MKFSLNRGNTQSHEKSSGFHLLRNPSPTVKQQMFSSSKDTKLKPLSQLISMKQNHQKMTSSRQHSKSVFNNPFKNSVLTKEINLINQPQESFDIKQKSLSKNSNSKTKLQLSIRKSKEKHQTPLQTNPSTQNLSSNLKKQKISLFSKIQILKVSSFEKTNSVEKRQMIEDNKENQEENHIFYPDMQKVNVPDEKISKLVLEKLNGKKEIFGSRPIKTTRELIQMKETKQKDKIKIKLQKKTKNQNFRV